MHCLQPVGMAHASFILAFSIFTGIVKKLLKTRKKEKKKKHNKIVMLARSKLNSMENKISEALINNEIRHQDFMTIINEVKKYRGLKESITMINCQRSDVEKINLIEKGKKWASMKLPSTMKLLIIIPNCKYKMECYCMRCKKYTKNIYPRVSKTSNDKIMILLKCVVWGRKKLRFINKQEAKGLLSNLGLRTLSSKIPLLGDILF